MLDPSASDTEHKELKEESSQESQLEQFFPFECCNCGETNIGLWYCQTCWQKYEETMDRLYEKGSQIRCKDCGTVCHASKRFDHEWNINCDHIIKVGTTHNKNAIENEKKVRFFFFFAQ